MTIIFAISYYIARHIIPISPGVGWMPTLDTLVSNMARPRSWLSFILTFGIPGVLALFIFKYRTTSWFQEKFVETATLITGLSIAVLLYSYSMLSAYADGRFIWTSYPFTIPLAVIVLTEAKKAGTIGISV